MPPQRVRTAVTMGVLVLIFCAMALWGVLAVTSPFGSDKASGSHCTQGEREVQRFVTRKDVVVSVYNAGARRHFARTTLERLESRGFKAGEVGNSPTGKDVAVAVVYTDDSETAPAELVARTLGKKVRVVETDEAYGPGVDVLVGPGQHLLDRSAPKRLRLHTPVSTCVSVD